MDPNKNLKEKLIDGLGWLILIVMVLAAIKGIITWVNEILY